MKTKAKGKEACLLYQAGGTYIIRIYEPDLSFTDYDIKTHDLFFTITSEDAVLVKHRGETYIEQE